MKISRSKQTRTRPLWLCVESPEVPLDPLVCTLAADAPVKVVPRSGPWQKPQTLSGGLDH